MRKAKSLELALESDQHSNPKLSHSALNSCQENPNLRDEETPQANPTALPHRQPTQATMPKNTRQASFS